MRTVLTELNASGTQEKVGTPAFERLVAGIIWKQFYRFRDAGKLKIKVAFFTKDVSGFVSNLLVEWFGPDPGLNKSAFAPRPISLPLSKGDV